MAFDPSNKEGFVEKHPLPYNPRVKIFSEEFDLEMECTIGCGYDLDFYSLADWNNEESLLLLNLIILGNFADRDICSQRIIKCSLIQFCEATYFLTPGYRNQS